jgi:hypothetical protein
MRRGIERICEQALDRVAAKNAWRQADVVDYHQLYQSIRRPRITIG